MISVQVLQDLSTKTSNNTTQRIEKEVKVGERTIKRRKRRRISLVAIIFGTASLITTDYWFDQQTIFPSTYFLTTRAQSNNNCCIDKQQQVKSTISTITTNTLFVQAFIPYRHWYHRYNCIINPIIAYYNDNAVNENNHKFKKIYQTSLLQRSKRKTLVQQPSFILLNSQQTSSSITDYEDDITYNELGRRQRRRQQQQQQRQSQNNDLVVEQNDDQYMYYNDNTINDDNEDDDDDDDEDDSLMYYRNNNSNKRRKINLVDNDGTTATTTDTTTAANEKIRQSRHRHKQQSTTTTATINKNDDDFDTDYYRDQNNKNKEYYNDEDDDDDDDDYYDKNDQEDDSTDEYYYDSKRKQQQLVWEQCSGRDNTGMAYVLLPPSDVTIPSCIIHFVGGTVFGSSPTIWYKNLLEDIVQNTNAVVIATSIPITIFTSPLQHIQLAKRCLKQFITAYQTIVLDEYCYDTINNGHTNNIVPLLTEEQFAEQVPICGIGHSLGARLLTVLTTSNPEPIPTSVTDDNSSTSSNDTNRNKRRRQQQQQQQQQQQKKLKHQFSYKSFILISFTNYGAASGIPGIYQLLKQSEKIQEQQVLADAVAIGQEKQRQQQKKQRTRRRIRNEQQRRRRQQQGMYDDYDDDDDDDDDDVVDNDILPIVTDILDKIRTSSLSIKSALTPVPEELEFYPTPNQLWKAIVQDKRYRVPKTLLIQFDNDRMDQSSKLASYIMVLKNGTGNTNGADKNNNSTLSKNSIPAVNSNNDMSSREIEYSKLNTNFPWLDIKFARLRGNHLTPVSIVSSGSSSRTTTTATTSNNWKDDFSTSSTTKTPEISPQVAAINQVFRTALSVLSSSSSKGKKYSKKVNDEQFIELRQTIVRYINDVVKRNE